MYAVLPGTEARALFDHSNTLPKQRLELLAELVCKTKQLHGLIRDKTSLFIQMLQFCSQSLPAFVPYWVLLIHQSSFLVSQSRS